MTGRSLAALAQALSRGETSAVALTEAALARIAETNDGWRIFIAVDGDAALSFARDSDERRRGGQPLGPLDGIPFAVKDNLDAAGFVTSNGARAMGAVANEDAVAVARLKAAGAVLVGKLNMHEGALGATTDNPFWGRCENPALPGHTPGGSSGGSAAAIAAGIVPLTLGTDTLGSVRIPAAYCGLWGLKPTFGLVSRRGMTMLSTALDTIGPLVNSADDLALALDAIAGFDPHDPDSVAPPAGWSVLPQETELRGRVFGVPATVWETPCQPSVLKGFKGLLEAIRAAGGMIRPIVIDGWEPTLARRAGLLVLEAEASVRLGPVFDRGGSPHSAGFEAMIGFGRTASGEKIAAAYRRLALLRNATLRALGNVDAILMPTAPQAPFAHGAPAPASQADFTALASIAGCPAVCLPHGFGDTRPAGSAQLVGAPFSESALLGLARATGALA